MIKCSHGAVIVSKYAPTPNSSTLQMSLFHFFHILDEGIWGVFQGWNICWWRYSSFLGEHRPLVEKNTKLLILHWQQELSWRENHKRTKMLKANFSLQQNKKPSWQQWLFFLNQIYYFIYTVYKKKKKNQWGRSHKNCANLKNQS